MHTLVGHVRASLQADREKRGAQQQRKGGEDDADRYLGIAVMNAHSRWLRFVRANVLKNGVLPCGNRFERYLLFKCDHRV